MAEYVLHCFGESGNSYKAALMLELCGCAWEPRFVDYLGGATRSDAYRDGVNETGEIPVLEHEGRRLSQSGVILTYLAERTGRYLWRGEEQRLEVLRWLLFDNHKFTSYLATYRFLFAFAKSGEPAVMEFLKGRITTALGIVSKHLSAQQFMAGAEPTIADLSMCGYLFYPVEEFGFDIAAEHPEIGAWLERIRALPGWKHPYELMPGHPLVKS
jgi:glutathione S-transferase